MASLHDIQRTAKRPYRRVGRGQSSSRGKQSGRGGKGQTARAGAKIRPALRDIIKKLPKRRGWGKNRARTVNTDRRKPVTVSLVALDRVFVSGAEITPVVLREKGFVAMRPVCPIKIVGNRAGKAFTIKNCSASPSAKEAIEKAGGSIMQ